MVKTFDFFSTKIRLCHTHTQMVENLCAPPILPTFTNTMHNMVACVCFIYLHFTTSYDPLQNPSQPH